MDTFKGIIDVFDNDTFGKITGTVAMMVTWLTGAADILRRVMEVLEGF
jgi:hypothetical protein